MEPWIPVKPYQTSMMVFLSKNSFFKKKKKKNSLIDVWFGSKYTSGSPLFMILPIILVAK